MWLEGEINMSDQTCCEGQPCSWSISILRRLVEDVGRELSDYLVGFVILQENLTPKDATLGGSGTLVEIEGIYTILTADHVIESLPPKGEVGLVLPTRFEARLHRVTLAMELVEKLTVARGKNEMSGPDLALLILPSTAVGTIKATKSFYSIVKRRDRVLANLPTIDEGSWLLSGMVHERTQNASPEKGYERVKIFHGLWGAGIVKAEYTKQGYDYLDFEVKYDGIYEGPESFKGLSGGGLWHVLTDRSEDGKLEPKETILSGVAFYQSAIKGGLRTIRCHGRTSIYEKVIEVVRERTG
jgi:hypothetical protein